MFTGVHRTYGCVTPAGSFDQQLGENPRQKMRKISDDDVPWAVLFTGYHGGPICCRFFGGDNFWGTSQSVQKQETNQVWGRK